MPMRQRLVIDRPQLLEGQLAEAAGVGEDQRGLVLLDELDDLAGGIDGAVAAPGHLALGDEDREVGLGAGIADDEIDQ